MRHLFIHIKKGPQKVWSQILTKFIDIKKNKKDKDKNSTFAGPAFFIRCLTINQKLQYANEIEKKFIESTDQPTDQPMDKVYYYSL